MLVFTSVMHKTAKCLEYICRRIFIRKRKVLSFYIWLRFRRKLTFRFYFRRKFTTKTMSCSKTFHINFIQSLKFIQDSMEAVIRFVKMAFSPDISHKEFKRALQRPTILPLMKNTSSPGKCSLEIQHILLAHNELYSCPCSDRASVLL